MNLYDRIVVVLGNFMGGPDEEFDSSLNAAAVVIGAVLAVLIVRLVI